MSAIVLDASVAVAAVTPEALTDAANRELAGLEPTVPDVFWGEVVRALSRKVLEGDITREAAAAAIRLIGRLVVRTVPTQPLAEHVLEIALDLEHPVYDCVYLAAAMAHGLTLVTADRALCRKVASAGLGDRVRLVEAG